MSEERFFSLNDATLCKFTTGFNLVPKSLRGRTYCFVDDFTNYTKKRFSCK